VSRTSQPTTLSSEAAVALARYRQMLLIRRFEDEMQRQFLRGEIHGTIHLYTGQEAVAVGVCSALEPTDYVAATYRGHGAALACGTTPEALAAELMGRATGVCGGRAGSMNVVDLEHGLIGCFGIVGGSIAAALGAALSAAREARGRDARGEDRGGETLSAAQGRRRDGGAAAGSRVAIAFFGDGAANQAYFHECLNFARVARLPAVFVCENNLYGEFTPMARVTAGADIAARAAALDIPATKVDGNDVDAVAAAAHTAVERARAGDGPSLLECLTYRHLGHSKSDPATYRPKDEVESWLAQDRDPVARQRTRLADLGALDEATQAEREVEAEIEGAAGRALVSPYPNPAADGATEFAP
jgi:TPP-dependent pyruvate/acetoin dehydrogenase alpha subunit